MCGLYKYITRCVVYSVFNLQFTLYNMTLLAYIAQTESTA